MTAKKTMDDIKTQNTSLADNSSQERQTLRNTSTQVGVNKITENIFMQ